MAFQARERKAWRVPRQLSLPRNGGVGPERCRALPGNVHRDQAGRGAQLRGLRRGDGASPGARGEGRRCWQETREATEAAGFTVRGSGNFLHYRKYIFNKNK